jgi:hypothetical protein
MLGLSVFIAASALATASVDRPPASSQPDHTIITGVPAEPIPLTLVGKSPTPPIEATRAEVREQDLLLLAVDLDGLSVTDALPAYGAPEDPLLPLGELARLLDLDVTVQPAQRRVVGRLGEAQRALIIDIDSGVGRLGGRDLSLTPQDVAVTGAEIYVRASALQRILPVAITTDQVGLQLKLKAREKLPIQSRLERSAAMDALRPESEATREALHIESPYALVSLPAFDVALQTGASAIAPRFPRGYDIRVGADLLYTGFQGYVGSDQNGQLASVRASFERHDTNGGLLGPINATKVSAGDIYTPSLAIGARSISGRGVYFSNAPLEQTTVVNRIDLRGDLPIGYDVQLYINDVLRSGQRTPVQGRYEFLNVPLVSGRNVIRIVLNGPTGQQNEQTQIINVGGGQIKRGALNFEFGAAQQDTPLITAQPANALVTTPGQRSLNVTGNLAYGLTKGLTVVGGLAFYTPNQGRGRVLATAGARTSLFGTAVLADAAGDDRGDAGVSLSVAGKLFGVSAFARHSEYFGGFVDQTVAAGSDTRLLARHSEINVDFNASPRASFTLPVTISGTQDVFADHSSNLTAKLRTSATLANILVSSGLDYQSNATAASMPGAASGASTTRSISTTATGNLAASTFYHLKWQLRTNLDYSIMPSLALRDISATADRALGKYVGLHLGLGRSFASGDTSFQGGAIVHTRYGDVALSGNYTVPHNTFQIGLSLSFGLVFDPNRRRYVVTRSGPGSGGSVAFRSFIDANGNGAYDAGDRPVAHVAVDGGENKGVTGSDGRVLITGLGTAPAGQILVGLDNIDEAEVHAPPRLVTFAPRAGLVVKIPYPMTPSGEVIVHVMLDRGGGLEGLSAVRVRLTPEHGKPRETSTEFDGTADFEQLGVGAYDFQLDPEQAGRLHMRLKAPVRIIIPANGGSLPDVTAEVIFEKS